MTTAPEAATTTRSCCASRAATRTTATPVARSCYHCGGSVPPDATLTVDVDGAAQPVCCPGCQAAASGILSQGLGRFYQFRSGTPPRDAAPPGSGHWAVFDRDASLRRCSHLRPDGRRELSLQIDGMHCAACAWLIESSLGQLPGVASIIVNPSGARAELCFDPARVPLSQLLERIHRLGYRPRPLGLTSPDEDDSRERRAALRRLAVAGLGMMQVMTFAVSLYAGAMQGMDAAIAHFLRIVSLIVATPVVLYSAQPFFSGAWRSVRAGRLGMDVPVAVSIAAAYLWSLVVTLHGRGTVYFDSAVMFTFFLLLGRYVEMSLRHRSGLQQHALARLLPDSVLRVAGAAGERVAPDELIAGDCVRVLPGERVAADGRIERGRSELDESLLTGESTPRLRGPGEEVTAGTLNLDGVLEVRVTRVGADSTLAAVSRLIERAQAERPRFADQADRVAAWFVAGVLLLALVVGLYWLHADPARAFPTVLAVLVVTCPCALSLATPAVIAAASTRLARDGLLITRGRALERLATVDRAVFDKTGTLTSGQPLLQSVRLLTARLGREQVLAIAAALERQSSHPIARAFASIEPAPGLTEVQNAVGLGIEASIGGVRYRIGRPEFVQALSATVAGPAALLPTDDSTPAIALGDAQGLLAAFSLSDGIRSDARPTIEALRARGVRPLIASGDRAAVVEAVSRELGIEETRAALTAEDKLELVRRLQRNGHQVAMIGDGINDAPVLSAADVSIAVGSGTDLAKVRADLVLMGQTLRPLVRGIDTARRARRIIRQNLCWAVLYNATAVPLAALGWIEPWMAAIGMSLSSLLVVTNALRLRKPASETVPPAAAGSARAIAAAAAT